MDIVVASLGNGTACPAAIGEMQWATKHI